MSKKWRTKIAEPSTWAGVGLLLSVPAHFLNPDLVGPLGSLLTGIAGIAAIVLREKGPR